MPPKNPKNYTLFMLGFVEVGFEVGFNPTKKRKNEPPHLSAFYVPPSHSNLAL
jgi:hypothetical protein